MSTDNDEDPRLAAIPRIHDYHDFLGVTENGLRFPRSAAEARREARLADIRSAEDEWRRSRGTISDSRAQIFHMARVSVGEHMTAVGALALRAFPSSVASLSGQDGPVGRGAMSFIDWWHSPDGQAVVAAVFENGA